MERVGIIGIGLLGSAMAERLLQANFNVVGYDPNPQQCEWLTKLGGEIASSAAAVAMAAPRILLSLPTSEIAAKVVAEIASSLSPNAIVIDTTTGDPETMKALAKHLASVGASYLDSTVAGSSKQARRGEIVMMVGGEERAFAACRDIYDALAQVTVHVGGCGSGAQMKLVVNLVLGLNRAVLAEGLALARSMGLDLRSVLQLLTSTVAYSRVMDTKGEKMVTGDFSTEARLSQHLKDVRLILATASAAECNLPFSKLHENVLAELESAGHGDDDNSAIFTAYD